MSVIPIDEAGIEAAKGVLFARAYLPDDDDLRAAVSAYLSAIGAEVEYWGLLVENGKRSPLQQRIVTPYKPCTTTEEETDGC